MKSLLPIETLCDTRYAICDMRFAICEKVACRISHIEDRISMVPFSVPRRRPIFGNPHGCIHQLTACVARVRVRNSFHINSILQLQKATFPVRF
jgi:hypothetical protein